MKRLTAIFLCLCLILCGCTAEPEQTHDKSKLQIVCTSFPAYDFAREIAADRAELTLLIKPGSEVHSYEPTPKDIDLTNNDETAKFHVVKADLEEILKVDVEGWKKEIATVGASYDEYDAKASERPSSRPSFRPSARPSNLPSPRAVEMLSFRMTTLSRWR